jgi:two-component system phosphate regulon sensor histidine kinase PhoR
MINRWLALVLTLIALILIVWHPLGWAALIMGLLCVFFGAYIWVQATLAEHLVFGQSQKAKENLQQAGEWERLAKEARADFTGLAEGMESAVFVCSTNGVVEFGNQSARRMFEFDSPQDKTLLALTLSYNLHDFFLEVVEDPRLTRREMELTSPTELIVRASIWPQPSVKEKSGRFYVALRDITELRRLEKIRQDFVANVSHELRTPLSSIRAMAETILDDPELDSVMREKWLYNIIKQSDRLATVANDLLILSHAESQPPVKTKVNLGDMIDEVVANLKPLAKEVGLNLEASLQGALFTQANREQMQQVFSNLIQNAIQYTPEGEIKVVGREEDDHIIVSVSDTGIGIMSEDLPRIFERFYRVDKARSRATGGTGLGLSIVKHIVESHGGTITVKSEYRVGATFTVRLPKV